MIEVVRHHRTIVCVGLLAALAVAQFLFSPETRPATTHTLRPVADAYVNAGRPGRNYGHASALRTEGAPSAKRSYLRFNVDDLPAAVQQATLRLFSTQADEVGFAVHAVQPTRWNEGRITFENAPPVGGIVGHSGALPDGGYVEVDVTAEIRRSQAAGRSTVTLALARSPFAPFVERDSTDAAGLRASKTAVASRETRRTAPKLVIVTEPRGTTTSTAPTTTIGSPSTTTSTTSTVRTTTTLGLPPTTTVPPPPPTSALWSAGMESATLSEWSAGGGGGLYNSGSFEATASSDVAHNGSHSLRARIQTPSSPTSGVRAFRWAEARANRSLYYSVWVYLPTQLTVTGDPSQGQFMNLLQFKSRSADGSRNDPVWAFFASPDGSGGLYLRAGWGWGGTTLAGPRQGDGVGGKWLEPTQRVSLPVGRWTHLEAYLSQSKDFDGRLTLWQDGTQVLDLNGIRTSYANCSYNSWCASNEWSVNLYSDGLSPNPATMYIDSAAISREYVS